jgi:4-hydroxyphenylpyruvate dioxygenase-like putative hemolysin
MLWAALIGFFFELVVRLGGGEGFGDALLHFGAWSWVASETT